MFCKFLITILCLFCSGSFGQHNWHGSEMGDNGKAGDDVIIPRTIDDSMMKSEMSEGEVFLIGVFGCIKYSLFIKMFCKFLITILCLFCSGSFGQHNWHGSEMGDNGKAGDDVIIPRTIDDSMMKSEMSEDSDDDEYKVSDGMYPRHVKLPKCSKHKYYGELCKVKGYQSKNCPRKPCMYETKVGTTATMDGVRISIELAKTYRREGSQCEERKDCSEDCKCATIWCKAKERKMTKIMGKYYKKMRVYIPYPCGCQCRGTSMDGMYGK